MNSLFCFCPLFVFLEIKLCSELRQTRTADGVCDSAEIGRILQINVGDGKVRRVENVENIQADFKTHPLVDARPFDDSQIDSFLIRTAKSVAPQVAVLTERRRKAAAIDYVVQIVGIEIIYRVFRRANNVRATEAQAIQTTRTAR